MSDPSSAGVADTISNRDSKDMQRPPSVQVEDLVHPTEALSNHSNDFKGSRGEISDSYPLEAENELPSPPEHLPAQFVPFFTLVEDVGTSEHYHPSVHYIFDDDDPELLTAASIRALGGNGEGLSQTEINEPQTEVVALLPPPQPGIQHRYLFIDLALNGHAVRSAHSLSSEWQVTKVHVSAAPTWGEDGSATGTNGVLMLKVDGMQPPGSLNSHKASVEDILEDSRNARGGLTAGIGHLMHQFNDRMGDLEAVFREHLV